MYQQRKFSPAVEKALAEVCPSEDPIDSPDFDPIAYINAQFPDEDALKGFGTFYDEVKKKKEASEVALLNAVRTQATTAGSAAKDLGDAQAAVVNLHQRVSDIKNKAAESEKKVQDLCSNIRQLDIAKTNISSSLKALKRLQHWILNVKQLEKFTNERVFSECHAHLKSAMENSAFFEKYESVKKFEELRATMKACTTKLEWQIKNTVVSDSADGGGLGVGGAGAGGSSAVAVSGGGSQPLDPDTIDTYRLACLVVDLMGKESWKKIVDAYIKREMNAYERLYARGSMEAEFRLVTTRYTYFIKRLEAEYDMLESVFPPHWCVLQELCLAFCLKTRLELEHLLRVSDMINVEELTYVMEGTVGFENALTQRCRNSKKAFDQTTGAEIKLPDYRFHNMLLQCFDTHMSHYLRTEEEAVHSFLLPLIQTGVIADTEFVVPPPKVDGDRSNNGILLHSADDLFVFLSARLAFAKSLSQQQTLIDIAHIWVKELKNYCDVLRATLRHILTSAASSASSAGGLGSSHSGGGGGALVPSVSSSAFGGITNLLTSVNLPGTLASPNSASSPPNLTLSPGAYAGASLHLTAADYTRVCILINTVSYCTTTIEAIQTSFLDPEEGHIAAIKSGPQVDTDGLQAAFEDVVDGYKALYAESVSGTVGAIKGECLRLLWESRYPLLNGEAESGGGGGRGGGAAEMGVLSTYATGIIATVRSRWYACALTLEEGQTMSYFLDKLAYEIGESVGNGLFRATTECVVIPPTTVERLIVDCKALQAALVALPYASGAELGTGGTERRLLVENPKRYAARVERSFDRHYKNLQMLLIPCAVGDPSVPETYLTVTHPSDWSLFNFERLMTLKGVPREQQRSWLTALSKRDVPDGRPKDGGLSSSSKGPAAAFSSPSGGGGGGGGLDAFAAVFGSPQKGSGGGGGGVSALLLGNSSASGTFSMGGGGGGGGASSHNFLSPSTSAVFGGGGGQHHSNRGGDEGSYYNPKDGVAQLAEGTKAIMGAFKGGAKAFTGVAAKLGKDIAGMGNTK